MYFEILFVKAATCKFNCRARAYCAFYVDMNPLSGKHCPIENLYMSLTNNIEFVFSAFTIFLGQQTMCEVDYFNFVAIKPCIGYVTPNVV